MKRFLLMLYVLFAFADVYAQPDDYIWTSPSRNSSESMPCGGGDIGLNVWAEKGDIIFYISRSGAFDENNTLLKQGRIRITFDSDAFSPIDNFKQILKLNDGYVTIKNGNNEVSIWVDVFKPVIHVEAVTVAKTKMEAGYENWRYRDRPVSKAEGQQCSYKWEMPKDCITKADVMEVSNNAITFYHKNTDVTVFDMAVRQQGMESVKDILYNPIGRLIFGGRMTAKDMLFDGEYTGKYADTDFKGWKFRSVKPEKKHGFTIAFNECNQGIDFWRKGLLLVEKSVNTVKDRRLSRKWWNDFWKRSYIYGGGNLAEQIRNYTLFRYMLGCNAYGKWPTKFNGGLFTFDPVYVDSRSPFTPDYRKWGGGTMTAQNQRLVYWPMLKSGDFDMMKSQFDCYMRMLPTAVLRSKVYWNHGGACFAEQLENFGLPNPAEYGLKRPSGFDKGVEYNAWLEYEWDTVLEFCQMIIESELYNGESMEEYYPLIEQSLEFFNQHYRSRNRMLGSKELDGNNKLVIYPGSGCETYKMAYNPASTIAALKKVSQSYAKGHAIASLIPEIPFRMVDGKKMIAPAMAWQRVNNVETPQLYPVFPWRIYGIGHDDIDTARNTYLYDADALRFRSHIGWKQDNIWAACIGLKDEAIRLTKEKMKNGPYRYPAFWGPDYDWTPDYNRGGSAMIGLQEMLMQEADGKIYLFAAWDKTQDIKFRLNSYGNTIIDAELVKGKLELKVIPESRRKDIVLM